MDYEVSKSIVYSDWLIKINVTALSLMGVLESARYTVNRYIFMVLFPTITLGSIYLDQRRTRWWKQQKLLEQEQKN
ncbi:hypothetical protein KPH14_004868 [Odynerus spinipes]|uniref:Uncharacterized protein n=1 Tax=Odynerus spinipes TaxID=1348599 RepID=A0AAD9RN56_9HYME|nr:hypothetical protein KPH14_004868 [Odynerus spinipes]